MIVMLSILKVVHFSGCFVKYLLKVLWDINDNKLIQCADVERCIDELKTAGLSPEDLGTLLVRNKTGDAEIFVDSGDYFLCSSIMFTHVSWSRHSVMCLSSFTIYNSLSVKPENKP